MRRTLLLLAATLVGTCAYATDSTTVSNGGDWEGISPNRKHFAALAVLPDERLIWRKDMGTGILAIVEPATPSGEITDIFDSAQFGSSHSFTMGERVGVRAEWSPDSRYLVVTTASLGGHSPWHFEAYLYCADDHTLRYMDDIVGLVISPKFRFTGPHTVRLGINADSEEVDWDHPRQVDIDLDQKVRRMKKQELLHEAQSRG